MRILTFDLKNKINWFNTNENYKNAIIHLINANLNTI